MLGMWQQLVSRGKKLVYGSLGEPYRFAGNSLRFIPGTRPPRAKYANAQFWVTRYDALTVIWLEKHLRSSDTAIDIGAHNGIFTVLMAGVCRRVIAFEPDNNAREALLQNLRLNPGIVERVTVEALACSDTDGQATFYDCHGNQQSALFRSQTNAEERIVPTVTLDRYIAEHGLTPSCVKIDAEGAEVRILSSSPRLLASDSQILCELHPDGWPFFGDSFTDFQSLLRAHGRRIRYLDQAGEPREPIHGMALLERP